MRLRRNRVRASGVGAALGLMWAAAAPAAVITIGSASGQPGSDVSIAVSLDTEGQMVLATQNRIDFPRAAAIAADDDGDPDCAVNAAIDKDATGFRFLPLGCDPAVNCAMVRTFVIAFDNLEPIPDGSVLYTCRVAIAADAAAGTYVLENAETGASAPGGVLLTTTGVSGAVEVVADPVASINAGSASGAPGELGVEVSVTLDLLTTPPAGVAAVQNDLGFSGQTPIVPTVLGSEPGCTVNPAIDKEATTFTYLPDGCEPGTDCTGIRALVDSGSNTDPIPDGAVLYTCTIAIADTAAAGMYNLPVSNTAVSNAAGNDLPAIGSAGAVTVTEPLPVCVGDCNGDGMVLINELLLGVNISTGAAALAECTVFDSDDDGGVAINELIQAVNRALNGCTG